MIRRDSLEVLKTRIKEIDRALSHGEWWLNRAKEEPSLAATRLGSGALTNTQKADHDAFVAKRLLRRQDRRH